jgi:hypothetical protein
VTVAGYAATVPLARRRSSVTPLLSFFLEVLFVFVFIVFELFVGVGRVDHLVVFSKRIALIVELQVVGHQGLPGARTQQTTHQVAGSEIAVEATVRRTVIPL